MNNISAIQRKAYELACRFHKGQVDKLGVPYIEHVKAVCDGVQTSEEKVVASLHDILEDTPCTRQILLAEGIPEHLIVSVEALTRRSDETYQTFIMRVAKDERARKVKLSDLAHNLDEDGSRYENALRANKDASPLPESLKARYREAILYLKRGERMRIAYLEAEVSDFSTQERFHFWVDFLNIIEESDTRYVLEDEEKGIEPRGNVLFKEVDPDAAKNGYASMNFPFLVKCDLLGVSGSVYVLENEIEKGKHALKEAMIQKVDACIKRCEAFKKRINE